MRHSSTSKATAKSHQFLRICLICWATLLIACQQAGSRFHAQKDQSADFNTYHTFGFIEVNEEAVPDVEIADLFMRTVRQKMESLGYRYSATEPDLLIHYQANIQNTLEPRGNAIPATVDEAGFHSHEQELYTDLPSTAETTRWSIERSGAARINIIDASRMQTVWRGDSEGSLTEEELIQPRQPIIRLVDKLFEDFPRRK